MTEWVLSSCSVNQKSWKWSIMALTSTPLIYPPAYMLWLAQSTGRVCLCLLKAVQVSPTAPLGQGEPDIHHSTLKAKLQSYPSFSYLLIWGWPDFSTTQMWCCLVFAEFTVLQLILVSASCAVWHHLGSWLCCLRYSCCQCKQEPRRSL